MLENPGCLWRASAFEQQRAQQKMRLRVLKLRVERAPVGGFSRPDPTRTVVIDGRFESARRSKGWFGFGRHGARGVRSAEARHTARTKQPATRTSPDILQIAKRDADPTGAAPSETERWSLIIEGFAVGSGKALAATRST